MAMQRPKDAIFLLKLPTTEHSAYAVYAAPSRARITFEGVRVGTVEQDGLGGWIATTNEEITDPHHKIILDMEAKAHGTRKEALDALLLAFTTYLLDLTCRVMEGRKKLSESYV